MNPVSLSIPIWDPMEKGRVLWEMYDDPKQLSTRTNQDSHDQILQKRAFIISMTRVCVCVCVCFLRIHISCAHGFPNTPMYCPFQMESPLKSPDAPCLPSLPHFPPQADALGSLTMGFILEYFLFFRSESTWEYFSWWECSPLKDLLFWKGKKLTKEKKNKFFRVKCRGSKMPNKKLKPCGKGDVKNYKLLAWCDDIRGVLLAIGHGFQSLTQMGEELHELLSTPTLIS